VGANDLSKKTIAVFSLLFLIGCSNIKVRTTTVDGRTCEASRSAFFMSSDAISGEVCGGKVGAKGSDSDAFAAAIAAAVSAAINAVVPAP